jgi:Ca2+-binding RTX toxin-like protein
MSIAIHTPANFDRLLRLIIQGAEGTPLLTPQNIGDGTITLGYGYTFIRGDRLYGTLGADLVSVGITLTEAESDKLDEVVAGLANIDDFIAIWSHPPITADDADSLFTTDFGHMSGRYQARFRAVLGQTQGDALFAGIQGSREWAAIASYGYVAENLIGSDLVNALNSGNRAEAWYQIRYGWADNNPQYNNGWAKRHYMESAVFGLYADPDQVGVDEAKETFRMLQLHRERITTRENTYGQNVDGVGPGRMIDAGNTEPAYALVYSELDPVPSIKTIVNALDPAKLAILEHININLNPADYLSTDIYLDPGRNIASAAIDPNHISILTGSDRNDILMGEGGNDVLNGGEGNDVLVGGKDNDTLKGGTGSDIYVYKSGDGADTITDMDLLNNNDNKIYVGTTLLTGATGKPDSANPSTGVAIWKVNGGEIVYELDKQKNTLVISGTALGGTGNSITIKLDAEHNDTKTIKDRFGINLPFTDAVVMTNDSSNPFEQILNFIVPSALGATMTENNTQNLNLAFNRPLTATDRITLYLDSCVGVAQDYLKLLIGDQTLDFSSGSITLNATEGQDFLAMSLLEQGDITTNGSATFRAVIESTDADGVVTTTESNVFKLDINDSGTYTLIYGEDDPKYICADALGSYVASIESYVSAEIHGGLGNDILGGGPLNDRLYGEDGHDAVFGGEGNDELHGALGNDLLNGGDGDDHVEGNEGNDLIVGNSGDDVLLGGEGSDWLYGGCNFGTAIRYIRRFDDPELTNWSSINRLDFDGWVTMVNGQLAPNLDGYLFGVLGGDNLMDGGAETERMPRCVREAANDAHHAAQPEWRIAA